jgi:hypothetical protein
LLDEYVKQIDIEETMMTGEEKSKKEDKAEGEFEVVHTMLADCLPAETIRKYTSLDESSILHCGN